MHITVPLEKSHRKDPYCVEQTQNLPLGAYPAEISERMILKGELLDKRFTDSPKWPEGIYGDSPKQKTGHGTLRYKKLPGCP